MSVLSQRSARVDLVRAATVAVLASRADPDVGAGGWVGGAVAESLRTPLLAAGWAFTIRAPIYVGFLVYAGYQLLPAQRGREIHRRHRLVDGRVGACSIRCGSSRSQVG